MKPPNRLEKDALGKVKVPLDAYFGAFTCRAKENFQISGDKAPKMLNHALGLVKLCAAETNLELGLIDKKYKNALLQACAEFMEGKFLSQFVIDIFQAGAGTSYNMNANEIIANRANELLKAPKGSYKYLHPNNHVNLGQSTNDVIPTTLRIAALLSLPELTAQLKGLIKSIEELAKKHAQTLKVGRTHLQDAVPISVKQEFDSYKEALQNSQKQIELSAEDLKTLGIGGTAVGTGQNAHKDYHKLMLEKLSAKTKIHFKSAKNFTETANNMNVFMNFSGGLRSLATNLLNFCSDLSLLNMGPKAGLSEISLPEMQAGSSIMPGKVNPSIPEAVQMVAMQVLGNDQIISLACQRSNLELNVFCPLIMNNLLQSMKILTNGLKTLTQKCVKGLKINKERITELLENSLATATKLAEELGYDLTAEIVHSALKNNRTLKEELKRRKIKY
ncbi:aspartate ammonia-lyase [Candidatus Peregrinibacteria bacterium]|nr:aspartate ammonia-lyase [Candidatus Peregrinibacteria bacterium]